MIVVYFVCINYFSQYSVELHSAQHFTELISRYAKKRKDNKAKLKSAKKEATNSKTKLSTLELAYDEKVRLVNEAKSDYESNFKHLGIKWANCIIH